MAPRDRPLIWLEGEVKSPPLSSQARVEAGYLLRLLQQGQKLRLPHSRPLPSIGPRCHEPRIQDRNLTWRIVYRVDPDAICDSRRLREEDPADPEPRRSGLQGSPQSLRPTERIMKKTKRTRVEKAGWKVGSAAQFLRLSPEEEAFLDLKVALAESLRKRRARRHLTQGALAKLLRSSQSRVAKMEASDPTVSLDLLVRSLLALGTSPEELARIIRRAA